MKTLTRWMLTALVAMLAWAAPQAQAQVRLLLRFEHASYLQFETVNAYVSIYNDADQPLCIGNGSSNLFSELSFMIGQQRDDWLDKRKAGAVLEGLVLEPGEQRDVAIDISRPYDLSAMGRYQVQAILRDKGAVTAVSPQESVEIVRGIEIERVERAVPGFPDRLRTYSVRYWRRNRFEYAFLSVDEDPGRVNYGVYQLGKIVRTERPTILVERDGKVTVRHLCAPDSVIRTVFMSEEDGMRFVDQRYENLDGTPFPEGATRRRLPLPMPTVIR